MATKASKVKVYKADEISVKIEEVSRRAQEKLGVKPFRWQLEVAAAVLQGQDALFDVGTGGGKSLCLLLTLLTISIGHSF